MSSSPEELQLQDELNKLEIAPTLPLIKLLDRHIPLSMNPFFDERIKCVDDGDARSTLQFSAAEMLAADRQVDHVAHATTRPVPVNCRRCRVRRRSESVLDGNKARAALAIDANDALTPPTLQTARSMPGVQRQTFKKTSGNRFLLREPILRTRSLHSSTRARRRLLVTAVSASVAEDQIAGAGQAQAAPGVATETTFGSGMADFRDLINECQALLDHDANITASRRGSKSFNTLRRSGVGRAELDSRLGPHNSSSITCGNASPSPEHNAATRTNTSCSQQAGNTVGAAHSCDDVTINELASYFDTLVHIPKKMSSMAEMMYI